jgi:hypothetical protein
VVGNSFSRKGAQYRRWTSHGTPAASQASRRTPVLQRNPAQIHASGSKYRRADSRTLSQRHFDGDFTEALQAIFGEGASGLPATNIVLLKASWEEDYKAWSQRDLTQKRYVYWWADGAYFNGGSTRNVPGSLF